MMIELYEIIEFLVLGGIILYLVIRNTYLKNELKMRKLKHRFDDILRQLKELNK